MGSDRPLSVPPIPLAMVVCDQVYRDGISGKLSLLGLFSFLVTAELPARLPYLAVYLSWTDANGPVPLRVRIIDVNEDRPPVGQVEHEVMMDDPRSVFEFVIGLGPLEFPEYGEYRVQVFASDEFLVERRITVIRPTGEVDTHDQ